MKRFRFSLERVLRLYRLRREEKERDVKRCLERQSALFKKKERIQREYRAFLEWMPMGVGTIEELRQRIRRHEYLDALKDAEMILWEEIRRLEEELEKRKKSLFEARKNEKALEKLKENRYLKWKEKAEREERKFLDEVACRRFVDKTFLQGEEAAPIPFISGD